MLKKNIKVSNATILIMGLAFKENCPDMRNTNVISLMQEFESLGCNVDIIDPWVDKKVAKLEYNINIKDNPKLFVKIFSFSLVFNHRTFTIC